MGNGPKRGRPEGVLLDGDLLRERRSDLGLSQSAVADLARLGARTVRGAENGEPVSPDTARLLASVLGLAYLEVCKPSSRLVREKLEASGLAPVRSRESWLPVPEEDALREALQDGSIAVVCVEGPDGIGKSALVRRVLSDVERSFPDGAVWVAADRLDTAARLHAVQLEIADCLGFRERLPDPGLVAPEAFEQAFAVHFWRGRRLLVLDGLLDPATHLAFVGDASARVVVTTSRRWVADSLDGVRVALHPWPRERILDLLGGIAGEERFARDPEGTDALLQVLGGLPLSARLAATGLQRARLRTLTDFATSMRAALAEVDPEGRTRDPLVRGLVDSVARTLGPEALHALREAGVFGTHHFAERALRIVLDRPDHEVRGILDELADAWLLQRVETSLERDRFQVAEWAVGVCGPPSDGAIERLFRGGPFLIDRLVERSTFPEAFERLQIVTPGLLANFAIGLERLFPGLGEAAPDPAEVPDARGLSEALDVLPDILLRLLPLLRVSPPQEAGRWLTAGIAVARGTDAEARLAWMLAWWWFLRAEKNGPACVWAAEAVRLAAGEPDRQVSLAVHACLLHRVRTGYPGAMGAHEEAVALARSTGCSPLLRASALVHGAAAQVFGRGGEDGLRAGLALLDEALEACPAEIGFREGVVHHAALLDREVVRAALGEVVDPERVATALGVVMQVLRPGSMLVASVTALARSLDAALDLPTPAPGSELGGAGPAEAEAALHGLVDHLGQMGADVGRVADGRDLARVGRVTAWITAGSPVSAEPDGSFVLFLPLDPVRQLLTNDAREAVLRFVAAVRSTDHPAYRALVALD
ncbi:MAG: helix-turn-helix transcriptional regulator [Alphaproteobacteria bacterium]|nr:helix-turn-helix transcriptional regulator [Alphaproteobacteria bacterium]